MRDLLRRLIDSLSELSHWLGDHEERQLSMGAVVNEVQAVARAMEKASGAAEMVTLTRRLHIVAAAAESEMRRTVHDLDQARHAAFRATVLAAELTIRSVRSGGNPADPPGDAWPADPASPSPEDATAITAAVRDGMTAGLAAATEPPFPPRTRGLRWLLGGRREAAPG